MNYLWLRRGLAIALCAALLFAPMGPYLAYASLDDGSDQDDLLDSDAAEDSDLDDVVEETSPAQSGTSDKISGYQNQISQNKDKLDKLAEEQKELESSITQYKTVKEKEVYAKQLLDAEIYNKQVTIETLLENIHLLEMQIEEKGLEIVEKQAEHDANYQIFLKRFRAMALRDETSTLGLILGADSFVDFLTRAETVARVTEHDQKLMANLAREREDLEAAKADLESDMDEVEETKERVEEEQAALAVKSNEAKLKIQDLDALEQSIKADLEKNKRMQAEVEAEIAEIYKRIEWEKTAYVGGVMAWPLPGYGNITSSYGWRFGGSDYHTGVDISGSGVHGSSIVAANDGVVKLVNFSYTQGRGYGIYLIIDHGGGISTLYAHCSNIVVSEGQTVTRGQEVAKVGSTGWSTGPHLHFEVRVNGVHTEPTQYITSK